MIDDFTPRNKKPLRRAMTPPKTPAPAKPAPTDTPAKVPAKEPLLEPATEHTATSTKAPKLKKPFFTKKNKIIIGSVLGLLILLSGAYFLFVKKDMPVATNSVTPSKIATATPKPTPTTVVSPLSGMQVEPAIAKRPIIGMMIENSPDARPQSGLKDASVVYEAIAEAGITRFLAIFQDNQPDYIGPVRSVRPYYMDFLKPYDAPIAHVGGSVDGLQRVKTLGITDLDQFANGGYYQRITARYAPHNVYTSMAKMDQLMASKGVTSSTPKSLPRKADKPAAVADAKTINLDISSLLYNVQYDYDATTNSYKRSEGGTPHIDEKSKIQITAKVVVAVIMSGGMAKANDGYRMSYTNTGSGTAYVFQDGGVTKGTWVKADANSQLGIKDSAGADIKLNAGPTWISVLTDPADISYKP